jgi:hypothetical protein
LVQALAPERWPKVANKKRITLPSHLQLTPHGYYFRYSVPPDVRPIFGRSELKCSLRIGKLSEAKERSRIFASLIQMAISNIRSGGRMSELSDT